MVLRLQGVRVGAEAATGRLLCLLLLCDCPVPTDPIGRQLLRNLISR